MRNLTKKLNIKTVLAAVIIVALAFLSEWGYVAVSGSDFDYQTAGYSADSFSYWEMEERGQHQYYMLANNSYYTLDGLGGIPVQAIDVYLDRPVEDTTECIIRYTGVKDGIFGEYVAPLTKVSTGLYTATLEIESLDTLKIYPTERVRTVIEFEGISLNPNVMSVSYSMARVILWVFLLSSIYFLYKIIHRGITKKGDSPAVWPTVYVFATTVVLLAAFLATRMFTSARGLQGLLLPAAFAGFSAIYLVVWLIAKKARTIPQKGVIAVIALGVLFTFATAPLQAPDEYGHYLRAYAIAQGDLRFDADHEFPDDVQHLVALFPAEFYNNVQATGNGNALSRIAAYYEIYSSPFTGNAKKTDVQLILPFIPSAIGMAVARLLGANGLICLYVGRLCNVAVFALCAYYALKWAARYRGTLMVALLLPLTLFMVASLSYDSAFLCCMALFLGLVFKESPSRRDILFMMLAFAGMVSIKPIYFPLALLLFTIPKEQFKLKVKRLPALLLIAVAGLAFWGLTLLYASLVRNGIQPQATLEGVNVQAQILYVLKNPLRYIMVMLVDGYHNLFYLSNFGLFGWLDVQAPLTGLLTPILFVLIGALYADQARRYPRRDTLWMGAVTILSYVIIVTGFYCAWSSLGSTTILGVQSRYFIPIVPCIVALISKALSPVLRFRSTVTEREELRDSVSLYLCASLSFIAAAEIALVYFLTS